MSEEFRPNPNLLKDLIRLRESLPIPIPRPVKTFRNRIPYSEAARIVERNSAIADYKVPHANFFINSGYVELAQTFEMSTSECMGRATAALQERQKARLQPYIDALPAESTLRKLMLEEDYYRSVELRYGLGPNDTDPIKDKDDTYFNSPFTYIGRQFERIMSEPDGRRELLGVMNAYAQDNSRNNLQLIDASFNYRPKKYDVVIIGTSAQCAILATRIGPNRSVLVITRDRQLSNPFSHRMLYLNSPPGAEDVQGPELPFLKGRTTPIAKGQDTDFISTSGLVDNTAKVVKCDPEQGVYRSQKPKRKVYLSSPKTGAAITGNIFLAADNFLLGQEVDPSNSGRANRGENILSLRDVQTGKIREIGYETVIYATGIYEDACPVQDGLSNEIFRYSTNIVTQRLQAARGRISARLTELEFLKQKPATEEVQSRIMALRRELEQVRIKLPQVLTPSALESLYAFWVNDIHALDKKLGHDPNRLLEMYPLLPLFDSKNEIAIGSGSGDYGKTMAELLNGDGPPECCPQELSFAGNLPQLTFYNLEAVTPQEFRDDNRARYDGVFTEDNRDRITPVSTKIIKWEYDEPKNDGSRNIRICTRGAGVKDERSFNYFIPTFGIRRNTLPSTMTPAERAPLVRDDNKVTMGITDGYDMYGVGVCANLTLTETAPQLSAIVSGLMIGENSDAIWLSAVNSNLLGLHILNRYGFDTYRVIRLVQESLAKF